MAGRLIGFVWHAAVAYKLGTTPAADIFLLASTIPLTVYTVLSAILAVALVPVFNHHPSKRNLRRISTWAFLFGLLGIAHPLILRTSSPMELQLSLAMTVSLPLATVCGVLMAWHFAEGRYILVPVTNLLNNLGSIAVISANVGLSAPWLGAWSVNAGWVIQLLSLVAATVWWRPAEGGREVVKFRGVAPVVWPLLVTQLALHVPLIGARFFAAAADNGSVSAYNYAIRVVTFPANVISGSVLGAAYPLWTKFWESGDRSAALGLMTRAFRLIAFVLIPTGIIFVFGAQSIVSLMFERGAFTHADSIRTAAYVQYTASIMFGMALWDIATRILHTQDRRMLAIRIVAAASVVSLVVEAVTTHLPFGWLAVVSGASIPVTAAIMLGKMDRAGEFVSNLRDMKDMLIPAIATVAAIELSLRWLRLGLQQGTLIHRFGFFSILAAGVYGTWLFASWLCRVQETTIVFGKITRKIRRPLPSEHPPGKEA
jgi:putative peptidoglycan lipid II flippase